MGRAIVQLLAADGARVAAIDRDAEGLDETARGVESGAGEVATTVADVSDAAAIADAVDGARSRLGAIDIVVNNAGVAIPAAIDGENFEPRPGRKVTITADERLRFVRT